MSKSVITLVIFWSNFQATVQKYNDFIKIASINEWTASALPIKKSL